MRAAGFSIALAFTLLVAAPAGAQTVTSPAPNAKVYSVGAPQGQRVRLAVDASGRLFYNLFKDGQVLTINPDGSPGGAFAGATIKKPLDVAVDPVTQDVIVLEDFGNQSILSRFDNTGTVLRFRTDLAFYFGVEAQLLVNSGQPITILDTKTNSLRQFSASAGTPASPSIPLSKIPGPSVEGGGSAFVGYAEDGSLSRFDANGTVTSVALPQPTNTTAVTTSAPAVNADIGTVVVRSIGGANGNPGGNLFLRVNDAGAEQARFTTNDAQLGFNASWDVAAFGDDVLWASGFSTGGDEALLRVDLNRPIAALAQPAGPVLTGQPLTLDASASVVALKAPTKYEWDLNNDGTFESDTGTTATVSVPTTTPAQNPVTVRVTGPTGLTDIARANIDIRPAPPAGAIGFSINDGAQYTNDPDVTLKVRWPDFSQRLFAANDGGFGGAQPFAVAQEVPWTLDSSGAERLPKTVYVRFQNSTSGDVSYDLAQGTFQDDIILDETAPSLRATARRVKGKKVRVTIKAKDAVSGVNEMRVGPKKKGAEARAFKRKVALRTKAKRVYVRVSDHAGNQGAWLKVKVKRKKK